MSKVTIAGDVNGTGVFTISAPNGNTNRTLVLPDEAGTMALQGGAGVGKVLQVANFQTGAVATGTAAFPSDDSIPQITEGTEFMTLAFTPTSATSTLVIEVNFYGSLAAAQFLGVGLFVDTTANALAAASGSLGLSNYHTTVSFIHTLSSASTTARTYRVRAGSNAGGTTTTINGSNSSRTFGGVASSSITITEVAA